MTLIATHKTGSKPVLLAAMDRYSMSIARSMGHFERAELSKIFQLCKEGLFEELSDWIASLTEVLGGYSIVL